MKNISKEIFEEVKTLLLQGTPCIEISKRLDISLPTVYKFRDKGFIERRSSVLLSTEEKELILSNYEKTKSCYKTASLLNISYTCVYSILKRNQIEIYNNKNSLNKPRRKYQLNEKYFDKIDSQEKAYILGFLYADGYNNEDTGFVKIEIHNDDVEVLNFIKKQIESTAVLNQYSYNVKRLNLNSKYLSICLAKLGCHQAKTFTLRFPTENQVPKELLRHFIRGYFDGDGCVSFYTNRKTVMVNFAGNEQFITQLSNVLKTELGIENIYCKKHSTKSIWYCCLYGKKSIKIFKEYMYADSTFSLERKLKKFQDAKY